MNFFLKLEQGTRWIAASVAVLGALLIYVFLPTADRVLKDMPEPILVIGPGTAMAFVVNGSVSMPVRVYGYDDCPKDHSQATRCVNVVGNRVHVAYVADDKSTDEYWNVTTTQGPTGKRISLARPDGSLVIQAQE